jgi:alpha-1,2-mannosyltransferase
LLGSGHRELLRHRLLLAGLLLWLAVGLVLNAANVAASLRQWGLIDLQVYRMGGGALLAGRPLYDVAHAHDNLPFTYTPFAAAAFVPFHLLGWTGGALAMTAASLAALARVAVLLARAADGQRGRTLGPRWLVPLGLLAVGLSMWPTRSTLEFGQINLIVLWLVVEDVLGAGRSGRGARWSGCLTGLAVGVKLTPAFLVPWHLATGERARAGRVVATAAATVAVGFMVQPGQAWAYWTHWLLDPGRVGQPEYVGNQSLAGLLHRAAGGPPPVAVLAAVALLAAGAALVVGTRAVRRGRVLDGLAAVVTGMLLVSPISWSHHWVAMLVVLAALVAPPPGEGRALVVARGATAAVLAAALQGRVMFLVPNGDGAEYALDAGQQALAGAYVVAGVAVLALLAVTTVDAGPTGARNRSVAEPVDRPATVAGVEVHPGAVGSAPPGPLAADR